MLHRREVQLLLERRKLRLMWQRRLMLESATSCVWANSRLKDGQSLLE
jgi:hypothetical protein